MQKDNLENMRQRLEAMLLYLNDHKNEDLYIIGHVAALLQTTKAMLQIKGD